jgi:hypothetical protein
MKKFKLIFLIVFVSIMQLGCAKNNCELIMSEPKIVPTTTYVPEPITSFTPRRVADLTMIAIALEKYKRENHSYPLSSDYTRNWDRYLSTDGTYREDWIIGLAPKYISFIPRDPRNSKNPKLHYGYRSNGAHYKLIAGNADDCEFVKSKVPELIDQVRDCHAYGFWTGGAVRW